MGKKLIIKNANFSENGILNPTWQIDYTSNIPNGDYIYCAPAEDGSASSNAMTMLGINTTKNKVIKFVELTLNTTTTVYNIPSKIVAYKIYSENSHAEKIKEFDYTISGNGDSMIIAFDEPIFFDNCYLGFYCYNETPGDISIKALVCGSKNLSDSVNYCGYVLGPLTFDAQGNCTFRVYSTAPGFAGYCPQVRIG